MAVSFDLAGLKVNGSPVPLPEWALDVETASFAVTDSGTLAYIPVSPRRNDRRLVWVDNKENIELLPVPPRPFFEPAISPDGNNVAVTIDGPVETIWILELSRHSFTPFTPAALGSSQSPVWTRDGKHIAFRGTRTGFRNVFWKAVDGSSNEEQLTKGENNQTPGSFSFSDQELIYVDRDLLTDGDIWQLSPSGDRKATRFRGTPANEGSPRISPDGHWLAYSSEESGKLEIYVLPFPGPGRSYPISTDGGVEPVWSHDGSHLFFRNGNKMMAVDVTTQPAFKASPPRFLFEGQYEFSDTGRAGYDVASDGRFLMIQPVEPEQPATQINLVLHWFEELKRLAPSN